MVKTTNQIGYCGTILIYEVYEPESSMNSPYLSWTHPTMVNPPLLLNNQWIQSVQTWSELVIRFIWSVAEWVQCLKWRNIRYPTQTWLFQRGATACQGCNFIGEVYNQFPMQGTVFFWEGPWWRHRNVAPAIWNDNGNPEISQGHHLHRIFQLPGWIEEGYSGRLVIGPEHPLLDLLSEHVV